MDFLSQEKCTGCSACEIRCKQGAITMKKNEFGFLYPTINYEICLECGLCMKICPVMNLEKEDVFKSKVYAAWVWDEKIRSESNSGGMAYYLAAKLFAEGYSVYGACICEDLIVRHIKICTRDELRLLKMSKYVQSDISGCFKNILEDINNNNKVVFFGTPCQIAGLKAVLNDRQREYVTTVDLICHGVPSPQFLKVHLERLAGTLSDIGTYAFRNGNKYEIIIKKKNSQIVKSPAERDTYLNAFLMGVSLKESCYTCKYAGEKRFSDMTLGDFWGLKNLHTKGVSVELDKGVNSIMINSERGFDLLKICGEEIFLEERELTELVEYQPSLRYEYVNPVDHKLYLRLVSLLGFEKTCKLFLFKHDILHYCKRTIYKIKKIFVR